MFKLLIKAYRDLKEFFFDLQDLDDRRKKIWFILATSLSITLVLIIWFIHFNNFVSLNSNQNPISQGQSAQDESAPGAISEKTSSESFWSVFGRGFKIFFKNIGGYFESLINNVAEQLKHWEDFSKNLFSKTNDFSSQGAQLNFVFKGLEPIPSTPLP